MYFCEKCGKEVFDKFGSGRFCSRECANSRSHSEETKKKISDSVKNNLSGFCSSSYNSGISKVQCTFCGKLICSRVYKKHIDKHNRNFVLYGSNRSVVLDITNAELDEYRKSHTCCEICGVSIDSIVKTDSHINNLCVDHDHSTNKFRGLLCSVCNRQLGWYENNKESINRYLSK